MFAITCWMTEWAKELAQGHVDLVMPEVGSMKILHNLQCHVRPRSHCDFLLHVFNAVRCPSLLCHREKKNTHHTPIIWPQGSSSSSMEKFLPPGSEFCFPLFLLFGTSWRIITNGCKCNFRAPTVARPLKHAASLHCATVSNVGPINLSRQHPVKDSTILQHRWEQIWGSD